MAGPRCVSICRPAIDAQALVAMIRVRRLARCARRCATGWADRQVSHQSRVDQRHGSRVSDLPAVMAAMNQLKRLLLFLYRACQSDGCIRPSICH